MMEKKYAEKVNKCNGTKKEFLLELYERLNEDYFLNHISNQNIFSLSFSRNGDLLSLWRGYGRKGVKLKVKLKATKVL